MKGTSTSAQRGFTIIETMIYLAIAGVMFLITIVYLGGKQRQTQFTQGVREFEASLNDIANDTSTGVFPAIPDIECTVTGNSVRFDRVATVDVDSDNPVLPGEKNDCVFVGSVVQLTNSNPGADDDSYYVHTLVGINVDGVSDFNDTNPEVLYDNGNGKNIDGTQEFQIPWGVTVSKAYIQNADGTGGIDEVNAVGYLYSNFGQDLSSGGLKTGVASISLYVNEESNKASLNGFRNSLNNSNSLEPIGDRVLYVCVLGADDRKAMIEIGGESGRFNATANFNPSEEC